MLAKWPEVVTVLGTQSLFWAPNIEQKHLNHFSPMPN